MRQNRFNCLRITGIILQSKFNSIIQYIRETDGLCRTETQYEGGLTMHYYYLNPNDHNSIVRINEEGVTSKLDLLYNEWVPYL